MNRFLNIPFLIVTIATLLGIVIGSYLTLELRSLLLLLAVGLFIFGILWYRSQRLFHKGILFTISIIPVFMILGATLVYIHDPRNQPDHYSHYLDENTQETVGIQFEIRERLKPTSYYEKYTVEVHLIDTQQAQGTLLLKIPKDSTYHTLPVGSVFTAVGKLKKIPPALNPNQFDYGKYLEKQNVYHQITLFNQQLLFDRNNKTSIYALADRLRTYINQHLARYPFTDDQLSIINALILGQRQDIDQQTFASYRDAGAIHILAVSGLHVGILLYMLHLLLRPLDRLYRAGRIIKLIVSITLLWCFAIVAGLSPSVIRAVTMFSFVAVGIHIHSKGSVYNSLIVSMFVLICFQPLLIFQVGFQLSYLAVLAILSIQPHIAKLYRPKYYIDQKLWETFTVTIAAQTGLLPLSIYYFHQFPLLFFISNLIIIPLLGYILGFGILIIVTSCVGLLPNQIAQLYGGILDSMNIVIDWTASQKDFLLTDITFSWRMLIICYGLLIVLVLSAQNFNQKRLYSLMILLMILGSISMYEKQQYLHKNEVIVFHKPQKTLIGVTQHQHLTIYSNCSVSNPDKDYILKGYALQNNIEEYVQYNSKNVYSFKDTSILIVDSTGIYNISLQPDILLLSSSPKIHLSKLIKELSPKKIIADGSNYKSYIDRWEKTCEENHIPFHRTDKKGAFILK